MLNQGRRKQRIKLSVKICLIFTSGFYGFGVLPLSSRFPESQVHSQSMYVEQSLTVKVNVELWLRHKKLLKFQNWLKVFSLSNQRYVEVSSATVWKVDFLSEYKFSLFSFQPHAPQFCFSGVVFCVFFCLFSCPSSSIPSYRTQWVRGAVIYVLADFAR